MSGHVEAPEEPEDGVDTSEMRLTMADPDPPAEPVPMEPQVPVEPAAPVQEPVAPLTRTARPLAPTTVVYEQRIPTLSYQAQPVLYQPRTVVVQSAPPPMTYAPTLHGISAQRFAQIAQGYPLTQEAVGQAVPPVPAVSTVAVAEPVVTAVAGSPAATKKKRVKKSAKGKGCCC